VSPKKLDQLPNVPALADTVAAAGVPGYAPPAIWYGIVAPKGTPKDVIAKLNAAMAQTLNRQNIRDKLIASGALPTEDTSSEYFVRVIQADYDRYAVLLKTLNITVE
jgi:tripartite-type tricarboxylate transporter receptor subunit TctC